VQQPCCDGGRIEAEAGQDVADGQAVLHVRLARSAFLTFVRLFGHLKGMQNEIMTGFAAQRGNVLFEQSLNVEGGILWHGGNCSTEGCFDVNPLPVIGQPIAAVVGLSNFQ
jgi:hypothetical protein